jgi:predicted PurR-regulated permease PerM
MNGTVLLILLAVVLIGVVAALVPLATRAVRLYRTIRRTQAELLPLADGLARRADLAAQKATAMGDQGQYLSERLTELQGSIARVTVLVEAMREASSPWGRLRRSVR